jgi:hypothetical protein
MGVRTPFGLSNFCYNAVFVKGGTILTAAARSMNQIRRPARLRRDAMDPIGRYFRRLCWVGIAEKSTVDARGWLLASDVPQLSPTDGFVISDNEEDPKGAAL